MENIAENANQTFQNLANKTAGPLGLPPERKFIIALNIVTAITAFVGNVLIMVALPKVSSLHPHSKLLFQSLASTDLCVGLITQPLYITRQFILFPRSSQLGLVLLLIDVSSTIFGGVSVFTVTAISVDRLLALLLGPRYRWVVTLKRVRVLVFLFWFFSSAAAMLFFYDRAFAIGITSAGLLLSVLASTFSYTKIYLALCHHRAQVQDYVNRRGPNAGEIPLNIARYRKTVSSSLCVQTALLACYLPYATTVGIFAITRLTSPLGVGIAWPVTLSLFYFNSTLNPFLYCWKMKKVRQQVKNNFRKLKCI